MLTDEAKEGLARILEISCPKDVEILEVKIVPGKPNSKSMEESVKAILKHVRRPTEILCRQNIKKDTLVAYLEEAGVEIQNEQSKNACVIQCLNKWHANEDIVLMTQRGSKEKIPAGHTSRLDKYMSKGANVVSQNSLIPPSKKLMEILETVEKRTAFPLLNKQEEDEEEVQVLSSRETSTESPDEILPLLSGISGKKRKSAPSTPSQIVLESINLTDDSPALLSESFNCFHDVSKPERNQSISRSVSPRCSPVSVYSDNQKRSTSVSKAQNSFSPGKNSPSPMSLPKPSSNEPYSFSANSPDTGGLSSSGTTKCKDGSIPVTPTSSSVTSHRVCKTETESQEPLLTEPFRSSQQQLVEMADAPSMGIKKGDYESVPLSPVTSYSSFQRICKAERESPERLHPSTPKIMVCAASVSNASAQTCLSEPPEFKGNRSTFLQVNRNQSAEKEISASNENLFTKILNRKRHLQEHPEKESTLSRDGNWNKSLLVAKRKVLRNEVSNAKRNKWTQSPKSDNRTSDFRNANRSQSTMSKCSHCEKQYLASSFPAESIKLDMASTSRGYKKKNLSCDKPSPKIQRRTTGPSKRAKESSDVSHTSSSSSTLMTNVKALKRKSASSLSEKSSPPHASKRQIMLSSKQPCYTPIIVDEHPKNSKESCKTVNRKKGKTSKTPKDKIGGSIFQTVKRKSSTSVLSPLAAESPTDCFPSDLVNSPTGSSWVPPEQLSVSESKLTPLDCESDTSDEIADPSTETPASPDLEKPLPPKRHCCSLI